MNKNIDITSNHNLNMTGSLLDSIYGNINATATSANIIAGENTIEKTSSYKNVDAYGSFGSNGVQAALSYSQGNSDILKTSYINSQIQATNGIFNLNTTGNATFSGANSLSKFLNLNIGGTLTEETKQTTIVDVGNSINLGINGGPTGGINGAGKQQSNITIGGSITDISQTYTENKTSLIGTQSSNILANNTLDNANTKDTSYTNADSSGQMSLDTRLFTFTKNPKTGETTWDGKGALNDLVSVNDAIFGASYRAASSASYFANIAKNNYDNAKEINDLTGIMPDNYDPNAHEKAAEAWGAYVGNPIIAGAGRTASEFLYQYPKYAATYDQQNFSTSLYDPLGMYDPSKGGFKPDGYGAKDSMSGIGYFKDSINDIKNSINGALNVQNNNN